MKKKEKKQSLDELLEEIGRTSLLSHGEVSPTEGAECGVAIENPKKNDFFFGILLAYS